MPFSALSNERTRRYIRAGLHPILFAAFPIISLYAQNARLLNFSALVLPLLAVASFLLVLEIVLFATFRRPDKIALVLSSCVLLLVLYALFFDWSLIWIPTAQLYIWAGATALAILLLSLAGGIGPTVTRVLNNIAVVLVITPLVVHGPDLWDMLRQARGVAGDSARPGFSFDRLDIVNPEDLPDIYYILVDEYAREDVLRTKYNHDNRPFLDALGELGFVDAPRSYANYNMTPCAIATVFNFDYFHLATDEQLFVNQAVAAAENAAIFDLLDHFGYDILVFPPSSSQFSSTFRRYHSRTFRERLRDIAEIEFIELLLAKTPVQTIRETWPDTFSRHDPPALRDFQLIGERLEALPRLAGGRKPVFVFMHLMAPHPPFKFNADGTFRGTASDSPDVVRGHPYADQVAGLNIHLLAAIRKLLASSKRTPVVVIQADHGARPEVYGYAMKRLPGPRADQVDLEEWMGILTVVRLPGYEEQVYPELSPVNTMRLVLSTYLKIDLPLIEERAFFSSDDVRYQFEEVTSLLNYEGGLKAESPSLPSGP
jgi:hypothetical protein